METDTCPECGEELGYVGVIVDEAEVVVCELLVCRNEDCSEWAVVYSKQGNRLVRVGPAVAVKAAGAG